MKGRVQVFSEAEWLLRAKSTFEEDGRQDSVDEDTTMMKRGDHHEGQLQYEFQTKLRSIVLRSTAFSLPVSIS